MKEYVINICFLVSAQCWIELILIFSFSAIAAMDGIGGCTLGEDYPPLSRHLLRLARMPPLPQHFQIIHIRSKPPAIVGIASEAVGVAVTRGGQPVAVGFPRTFPSRLLIPATFVRGTTPLASRRPQLLLLLLLVMTSPPPIFVRIAIVIATTGASRRIAMTTSSSAIPTFLSRGEEVKEKTLRPTTHGIHPPLPIVLPPRVLIHCYSASDYVRCRKEDDASSPPFPGRALSTTVPYPPLSRSIRRSERGGRCDLCW